MSEAPWMLSLAQAQTLLPAAKLVGRGDVAFKRVHSDTRSVQAGDLFVALKGERFDAHDFVAQAQAAGAVAVLASRAGGWRDGLLVDDTLKALQTLAQAWRKPMTLPLIAVTGSNGKTTVTQMIACILRAWVGDAAFATQGNFNNHIGVPLMLLKLRREGPQAHRAAVLELGMNHVGEIAELAALAQPTVALVNNAQREHQEFMASVQAVAQENGSVFHSLPADGVAVFAAGDEHTALWRSLAGTRRVLTFGDASVADADVKAHGTWQTDGAWALRLQTRDATIDTRLRAPGQHNLRNAAAAAASALAAGAPLSAVAQGLAAFEPVKGRLQTHAIHWRAATATLIDDSYNANPDSVRAAIDVLADMPAPRWLVLGDMGEVGDQGPSFHAEVGRYAHSRGIESLWCAGPLSRHTGQAFGAGALHFDTVPDLLQQLGQAPAARSVLVKGSRFMAMERVVHALQQPVVAQREGAAC